MEMEEIVDDDELKPLCDHGDHSKVEILVRTVGPARPTRLLVPSPIPVSLSLSLHFSDFGGYDSINSQDDRIKLAISNFAASV